MVNLLLQVLSIWRPPNPMDHRVSTELKGEACVKLTNKVFSCN